MTEEENISLQGKIERVESTLRSLTEILDSTGTEYFIAGSLARNMYMGTEVQSPEIDLIIPNEEERQHISQIIESEIQPAHPHITIDTSLSKFIEELDGNFRLKYGNIDLPIENELMEPQVVSLGNTTFKTFKPATLLHTYTFVGGPFREKDWTNSLAFARWMKDQGIIYNHKLYQNFHRFGKFRWNNSPLRKAQHGWRKIVDSLPESLRKQLLSGVYKMPAARTMRQLFNRLEETTCGVDKV